jgi:hypothetical protein
VIAGGLTDDCTQTADPEDLSICNYAPTTVSSYIRSVAEFAHHFNKPPDSSALKRIRSWQLFLLNEKLEPQAA